MITDNQLAHELQNAIARERSRIACDLHDGVAQQLALALLQLEYLQHLLENEAPLHRSSLAHIHKISAIIQNGLLELRHSISSSVPLPLAQRDFSLALRDLLDSYRCEGWHIDYSCDEQLRIPEPLEAPVYRFLQEALINIRKHARASHVTIHSCISDDTLIVAVSDDGCGSPSTSIGALPLDNDQHLGLRLMHDYIEHLGGQWQFWSQPGQGTSVQVRFPLTG